MLPLISMTLAILTVSITLILLLITFPLVISFLTLSLTVSATFISLHITTIKINCYISFIDVLFERQISKLRLALLKTYTDWNPVFGGKICSVMHHNLKIEVSVHLELFCSQVILFIFLRLQVGATWEILITRYIHIYIYIHIYHLILLLADRVDKVLPFSSLISHSSV